MAFPETCSFSSASKRCETPPEFILSVKSTKGDFMIAVACHDHRDLVREKILLLQTRGEVPDGSLQFEPLRPMGTDCVVGLDEDYADVEAVRGIDANNKTDR